MYNIYANEEEKLKWQIKHSSLGKISNRQVTYQECRDFACQNIVNSLTKIPEINDSSTIIDLPLNTDFHFLTRVDTYMMDGSYDPYHYYQEFENRDFISFSTTHNLNISHYKYYGSNIRLAYNITPDLIAHIFPCDSDTNIRAEKEDELTDIPSLWLTLKELNNITLKLNTYDQITCKTKKDGKIIKPSCIVAINELDENIIRVAKEFGIGIIIVHPNPRACCNCSDLYSDYFELQRVNEKVKKICKVDISHHYYF